MTEQDGVERSKELRRLLDERGVEWTADDGEYVKETSWTYMGELTAAFAELGNGITRFACDTWCFTPEQAIAATLGPRITGETSDGFHTFNELYHHRAVLFSVIVRDHRDLAWKSKLHHDGTMYDGMFIVGIETPKGQATYHYDIDPYWDMFDCKELDRAPEWDGHTPDDAIGRIATLGAGTCHDTQEDEERFCCSECGKKSYTVTQYREFDEYGNKTDGWIEVCTPHFCPNCGRRVVSE